MDSDEPDIPLRTINDWTVDDWQKDGRISGGGVVDLSTGIVVKRQNGEVREVTPSALKVAGSIAEDAIDNGAQIELSAESVEHHTAIDARGGEGSLVNLERVGALRRLHCRVDDEVELDGHLVYLNWLEGSGNEHIVRLRSGGAGHDGDTTAAQ